MTKSVEQLELELNAVKAELALINAIWGKLYRKLVAQISEMRGALPTDYSTKQVVGKCKNHPEAPHGFDRNSSHSEDRYVCECEHWTPSNHDNNIS
jgi:hypothetical protein